ncbi:MAG: hypothetical protein KatS3mg105_5078 [Gemmatales bacterium]|nr:MAG: hypothetical protein KatS3mg105_5078 [Gemmatales bacterium]
MRSLPTRVITRPLCWQRVEQSTPYRGYIPEPKRPRGRRWTDKPAEQQQAVYNNRRRSKRSRHKKLQRLRSERVERSFAHVCETGGARRTWLRGIDKVRKRYLIAAAARNLSLLMRKLFQMGDSARTAGQACLFRACPGDASCQLGRPACRQRHKTISSPIVRVWLGDIRRGNKKVFGVRDRDMFNGLLAPVRFCERRSWRLFSLSETSNCN